MGVFLSRLKRFRAAFAVIAGLMAASLIGLRTTHSEIIKQRPCDIYATGNTPCVAAHSTVRSLYAKYTGALYQVKRASDNATQNIGLLSDGTHFNSGCCFDYGNAETSGTDTGAGHMDTVNVSRDLSWANCHSGPGPGAHADLENGVFHWNKRGCNPAANVSGGPRPFISAWLKNNGQKMFVLKWGDAQSGGLNAIYSGALPRGYALMHQEGAIVLGVGGDNSHASAGSFFEG
jgi:Alpha-L-arabinofuranosidase B, catalytic